MSRGQSVWIGFICEDSVHNRCAAADGGDDHVTVDGLGDTSAGCGERCGELPGVPGADATGPAGGAGCRGRHTSELNAVSTLPGSSTVWAAGSSGASGSANPLVLQNG